MNVPQIAGSSINQCATAIVAVIEGFFAAEGERGLAEMFVPNSSRDISMGMRRFIPFLHSQLNTKGLPSRRSANILTIHRNPQPGRYGASHQSKKGDRDSLLPRTRHCSVRSERSHGCAASHLEASNP